MGNIRQSNGGNNANQLKHGVRLVKMKGNLTHTIIAVFVSPSFAYYVQSHWEVTLIML